MCSHKGLRLAARSSALCCCGCMQRGFGREIVSSMQREVFKKICSVQVMRDTSVKYKD